MPDSSSHHPLSQAGQKPGGGRFARPVFSSLSLRMNILLVSVIIIIFILAALTYSLRLREHLLDSHTAQLTKVGNLLFERAEAAFSDGLEETTATAAEAMAREANLGAESIGAFVWLVSPRGSVMRATGFPDNMDLTTVTGGLGRLRLPEPCIGKDTPPEGYVYVGSNYFGLFTLDGREWISYVRPIMKDGRTVYILQLHEPVDVKGEQRAIVYNSLGMTAILAAVAAMAAVYMASNRLIKPLQNMSAVAEQVAQGDFSVRVADVAPLPPEDELPSVRDEISILAHSINDMIEKIDHMNSDRRDLVSSISHDLRTPLTSIKGFVTGMLDGTIPPENYDHYLTIVQNKAISMEHLVNQMHDMSMLESNEMDYDFQPFNLHALINDVINSLEPQLTAKKLTVQTNYAPTDEGSKPVMVIGDSRQLERVFINLLNNAIKFTPDGGVISVSTMRRNKGKQAVITVEDSGPGLSAEDLNKVFNRFYKADRARTGAAGSGLGLYITRQILAAHGQHITAGQSDIGGAKFTFTLQSD